VTSNSNLPRIYVFVNSVGSPGPQLVDGDEALPYNGAAIDELGDVVVTCASKNLTFLKYDMGVTSHQKHDLYSKHFKGGDYILQWVDPAMAAGEKIPAFQKALMIAKKAEAAR